MKRNRKSLLALFLLACVGLGVGYSQLNDTLKVSGGAGVDSDDTANVFDADVYFSNAVANATRCTAEIDASDNDIATMTVKDGALKEVNDEVIATFTIKSESDLPCTVTPSITNGNNEYFAVTTTLAANTPLAAASTLDFTITVKLVKTAVADQTTTFTVTLNVQTV